MNRNVCTLFAATALSMLAACATPTANKAEATDIDDKVVVTGSRIPVKDRSSIKTVDDNQRAMDQMRMERNAAQPSIGR